MLNFLLDLLFPRRSLGGSEGEWITEDERKRMRLFPIRIHRELLRKKGIKSLDCLIAAGSEHSSPLLKKAIRTFKYGRIPDLGPELGKRIVQALPGLLLLPQVQNKNSHNSQFPALHSLGDGGSILNSPAFAPEGASAGRQFAVLCPVPLHWTRQFHRGFNQALILAEVIGAETSWPVAELLKRTRATGHQAWRKRAERLMAVGGAFAYSGPPHAPSCVLLVDDICTTGATLDACASALKDAGVKHVFGLTVAYG